MLFFYGIWMLCHHGQSPKKGEKSKQRFLGYNEKTHFPFVKSARKPRNVSFLTQNPRFLRIVGYPAALQLMSLWPHGRVWYHSMGYLNTIDATESNFEFRLRSRDIHS